MYELLSLAIHRNVFDENICKSVIGDNLVKRWDDSKDLISAFRGTASPPDDEFFEHFERLATMWRGDPEIADPPLYKRLWREIVGE